MIRILLVAPTSTAAAEPATALLIKRTQTANNMRAKICEALASPNASVLFAGLDQIYLGIN